VLGFRVFAAQPTPSFLPQKNFSLFVSEKRGTSRTRINHHGTSTARCFSLSGSLSLFVAVLFQFFLRTTRISFRTIYQNPGALLKVVCGEIFREGKINFCICRACCIQSSFTSLSRLDAFSRFTLSLSLSSNAGTGRLGQGAKSLVIFQAVFRQPREALEGRFRGNDGSKNDDDDDGTVAATPASRERGGTERREVIAR
jgi:hypothetical protein